MDFFHVLGISMVMVTMTLSVILNEVNLVLQEMY